MNIMNHPGKTCRKTTAGEQNISYSTVLRIAFPAVCGICREPQTEYGSKKRIWEEFGGYANYLDIEYYPLPLEGENRVLKPMSEFLKGNCGIELLLNSYAYLLLEEYGRSLWEKYTAAYTEEGLKTAGIYTGETGCCL